MGKYLSFTNPFIRFLLVGCINTFVGLTTSLLLLNVIELSYWFATFFGNVIGAICSFILNRRFTFKSDIAVKKAGIPFVIVVLCCYWSSYTISMYIATYMNLSDFLTNHETAVLLGTIFYTVMNYFGQKYMVFQRE